MIENNLEECADKSIAFIVYKNKENIWITNAELVQDHTIKIIPMIYKRWQLSWRNKYIKIYLFFININ